jgi:uncharacterized membrane protein
MPLLSQAWFVGGLLPAFCYGLSGLFLKVGSQKISLGYFLILAGIAIALVGILALMLLPQPSQSSNFNGIALSLLFGLAWGSGTLLVVLALTKLNGRLAVLAPLYNMNTLIVVILSLILFQEWTQVVVWKVLLGTLLIILGSVLVV